MKRSNRPVIAKDSLKILEKGFYLNSEGEKIQIKQAQAQAENQTYLFHTEALEQLIKDPIPTDTGFTTGYAVNDLTSMDSVRVEYEQDPQLLCLNFASAKNPGGGFLNGSQAQEESIARASGLYPCLLKAQEYYVTNRRYGSSIYTDHMIYSPGVPLFKLENGDLMEQAIFPTILTAPAVNAGAVKRNEPDQVSQIPARMYQRILMMLAICLKMKHKTLILGAWGCGVFRNEPEDIAKMFFDALNGPFKNQFQRVVFSVYAKEDRFIAPFKKYFSDK